MQTTSLLLAIQNDRHFTLKIRAELVEPAFDVFRSDRQIVESSIVNPFDSAIPGCNVSGRECPFRLHPPGDQCGQPQTDCFVAVMVCVEGYQCSPAPRQVNQCVVVCRYVRSCDNTQLRAEGGESVSF